MYNYIDENTIADVELKRKKLRGFDKLGCLGSLVLWGVLIWSIIYNLSGFIVPIFIPILITVLSIINIVKNRKTYIKYYKENLVVPNLKRNFPYYKYDATGKIPESDFKASSLYGSYNRYSGDDYFEDDGIKFSELYVAYVTSSSGSNKSSSRQVIFQGVFLAADLPYSLSEAITIKKRINYDKMPDILKRFLPNELVNPQNVVLTEDNEFNDKFILQSTNLDAKKIIDNSIIRKILSLGHQAETFRSSPLYSPISLSIIGNKLYMGVGGISLFNIKYGKNTAQSSEILEKSISMISLLIDFTDDIKKNYE